MTKPIYSMAPEQLREYKRNYRRGWTSSANFTGDSSYPPLCRADDRGEPDSWYHGYMDQATGREKWHMLHCPNHDNGCPLA